MNKETIDYTSEEFWATAPKDATHWEPESEDWIGGWIKICPNGVFYTDSSNEWETEFRQDECNYEELFKTFIPRPTTFTKPIQENAVSNSDNWFVDGKCVALPPVGTVCEIWGTVGQELRKMQRDWTEVEIIAHTDFGGAPIAVAKDMNCATLGWGTTGVFRPIKKEPTIQEKILEAWKAQGLDFAYDNEDTNFSFKVLVDFVVNNFDVKERD